MSGRSSISDFVERLEKLATPQTMAILGTRLGGDAVRFVNEGIDTQTDPYGNQYPPRTDGQPALLGLRNTFSAVWTGGFIRVTSSKWYARVHQTGAKIHAQASPYLRFRLPGGSFVSTEQVTIPQRRLAPTSSLGLGMKWTERFMKTTEQFFRDYLQGAARG